MPWEIGKRAPFLPPQDYCRRLSVWFFPSHLHYAYLTGADFIDSLPDSTDGESQFPTDAAAFIIVVPSGTLIFCCLLSVLPYCCAASFQISISVMIASEETASRFLCGLFFCHTAFNFLKIALPFAGFPVLPYSPGRRASYPHSLPGDIHIAGNDMMVTQIFIDIGGSHLARCNGTDYRRRSRHAVPAGKNAGNIFNGSLFQGFNRSLSAPGTPESSNGGIQYPVLPQLSRYHTVFFFQFHVSLYRTGGPRASIGPDYLRLHPQGRHISILSSASTLTGCFQAVKLRPFRYCAFHFFRKRRHVILASAVSDPTELARQAQRGTVQSISHCRRPRR